MFDRKGLFVIAGNQTDEEQLMEIALEAGADDVETLGDNFEVTCDPGVYGDVSEALLAAGLKPELSQITRISNNMVDLDAETARKALKLLELLDDHDDVQNVSSNFNIPEESMIEGGDG